MTNHQTNSHTHGATAGFPESPAAALTGPPLRYLCLTTASQLESDLDTWWLRMVGDRTIWGPGLDGWDSDQSMDENLERRFGHLEGFDAVFTSFSFTFSDPYNQYFQPPTAGYLRDKPIIGFLHEMVDVMHVNKPGPRLAACIVTPMDIVLHAYDEAELDFFYIYRELHRYQNPACRFGLQRFEHVPHHVRPDIYYPPAGGDGERDIDVLLVGRCHAELYELRMRWSALIAEGRLPNAHQVWAPYSAHKMAHTREELITQQNEFARLLRRAKIVLTCSSHWHYMLQKYTEIPASGAFMISDVPTNLPAIFTENMGVVHQGMSDDELVATVLGWLEQDAERQARAHRLSAHVREHYDMQHFWPRVDAAVHRWKSAYSVG